ncbi:MAG: TonB-dependent receptor [Prevotella sp.]|uniref:TonB-dependent receptor n=1 Tax=Prevotella sp. TaxID=59823 RepID=UPI002A33548B|nr:TonB-dependent receptor [Prevotella sp.]MDD7318971.1 TonB-dependent receptor [Prevotellaceae bacterium]MDY4019997.1 TonB-dependent receptor [Prevotella sp.]
MKKIAASIIFAVACANAWGQTVVSGVVTDAETGRPVRDANIRVDNSLAKGVTNAEGRFKITNLPDKKHKLSITHVSYAPVSLPVGTTEEVKINMTPTSQNIGQVVVTGTGTHHRLKDSPVPVQVVTASDIAATNATSLLEALQKISPSFTSMVNGMGSTVSLNGMTDDYYIFLVNGRRVSGDDTWQRMNVANIKRVEILNGAASTLYGTNAIGGVINIITNDSKNTVEVQNDFKIANKGRITESANLDVQKGKFGSYTSYKHQEADTWQLSPYEIDKKGELVETNKIASAGFHDDGVTQRFTYDANDRLSFYTEGNFYRYKTDRPEEVYNYDIKHETYGYAFGMKMITTEKSYITFDYNTDIFNSKYDYIVDIKDKKGNITTPKGTSVMRKRTRFHEATLKGVFTLADWNKLSVGVDYQIDALKSTSDNINKEMSSTFAMFVQDEMTIGGGLHALLGVRYLYHSNFHNYATPNVALMYRIGGLNLRANYAMGYKAPTLSEIYATDVAKTIDRMTIGNTALKAEKNNYFGFNAEYQMSWLTVSGNVFLNKVRDMIDYVTIAQGDEAMAKYGHKTVRQRQNINHASVLGTTLAMNANLGCGLSLNAAYTHLKAKDDDTDATLDKTIKNAWTMGAQWARSWGLYTLHANVNGRIYSRRFSESYGYAPHYNMWDISTRHTFSLKKLILEPGFGVENVFDWTDDRPYNSNYATLNPGRTFYVSCSIKFKY